MNVVRSAVAVAQHTLQRKPRLDWPDVAKGISILGVVLVHATQLVPHGDDTVFAVINQLLTPLRMPLFFAISGYFSLKVLDMTLGKLFTKRLWFFLVPYVVWAPVGLLIVYAGKQDEAGSLAAYLTINTFLGTNGQWFLYALVLFNLVLWLTRRMPPWAIILVSVSPVILIPFFHDVDLVARAVMYLPVFLIGAYCRPMMTKLAEQANKIKVMSVAVVLFVAGFGFLALRSFASGIFSGPIDVLLDLSYWPLRGVAAVLSIPVGVVLSVLVVRLKFLAGAMKFLGRHTLPIYLGHYFGLNALGVLFDRGIIDIETGTSNPLFWSETWVIVGVLFGLAVGCIFHLLSKVPVLGWTVIPPRIEIPHSEKKLSVSA